MESRNAMDVKSRFQRVCGWWPGLAVVAVSSLLAVHFAYRQLGGYDLSPLIDLSWRFYNGETPGVDFINTFPPLLLVAVKAVSFMEPSWILLTKANVFFTFLVFAFIAAVSGREKRSIYWWLSSAFALSLPLVYTNHLWHSSLSQLAAAALFFAVFTALGEERPGSARLSYIAIASAITVLSKQNVSLPVVISTVCFLLISGGDNPFRLLAAVAGGSAGGIFFGLMFTGMSFADFQGIYFAVAGRYAACAGMYWSFFSVATNYPLVPLLLLLGWAAWRSFGSAGMKLSSRDLFTLLFLALSLIPMLTDWDSKLNNMTLPVFVMVTHFFNLEGQDKGITEPRSGGAGIYVVMISAAFFMTALAGGWARERMYHIGPKTFYQNPKRMVVADGYFEGLKTGKRLFDVLGEMRELKMKMPGAKIFFGPRIEFGYVWTGSRSPKGLPLWWHPGTSYALKDETEVLGNFEKNGFDILVFLKGDRERMPEGILRLIDEKYADDQSGRALDVLRLKKGGPRP